MNVDFMDKEGEIRTQHYAFLVGEPEFEQMFSCYPLGRPCQTKAGEINHHDGGRGVYFEDPSGHLLEVITRPYGSGGARRIVKARSGRLWVWNSSNRRAGTRCVPTGEYSHLVKNSGAM